MNRSSRTRRPTNQLIAAPASGAKMIRLRRLFSIATVVFGLRSSSFDHRKVKTQGQKPKTLQLQNTRIVYIERFTISKDRNDDPEANSCFGCSNCHHDEYKQLSGNILEETGKRNESQVYS